LAVIWQLSFLKLTMRMHILAVSVFAMACALQTALISLQAWRGVPSHFNLETPLDAAIARVLAFGGFVLVACAVYFTTFHFAVVF